jgi:hypothetical protein
MVLLVSEQHEMQGLLLHMIHREDTDRQDETRWTFSMALQIPQDVHGIAHACSDLCTHRSASQRCTYQPLHMPCTKALDVAHGVELLMLRSRLF